MKTEIEKILLDDLNKNKASSNHVLDLALAEMDNIQANKQEAKRKLIPNLKYILSPILATILILAIIIPVIISSTRPTHGFTEAVFTYNELNKEEMTSIEEFNSKEFRLRYFDNYEVTDSYFYYKRNGLVMIEENYQNDEINIKLYAMSYGSVFKELDRFDKMEFSNIAGFSVKYLIEEERVIIRYLENKYVYYIIINTTDMTEISEIMANFR